MTILVTGGRGGVARALVGELLDAGAAVRIASRDPGKVTAPGGAPVVPLDLARPETLPGALDGVRTVFLYAEPAGIEGFLDAARVAKVERIVLLSSLASEHEAEADEPNVIARQHTAVEEAIAASGLAWTFVRPGSFATNALSWAPAIRAGEPVWEAYPESQLAPVHERDIAAVAAAALLRPGHDGATYPMTGPESITRRRQLELIAEATGRPVRIEVESPAEARERMIAAMGEHVWPGLVDTLLGYQAANDGIPAPVYDAVPKILGRPSLTFAAWTAEHAADFTAA
ncbi:(4-alkanoyl-5-oxo-2,5-dihydrofuran-3-yl)methyl phosphate reductase [Frankia sp. AiPs1]|uniref:NAD(P)H-binding protein n=1 Tax=Frankia sp. AiPa1 TaxID=573492 RepID=UPI00202B81BF|nr:NAD(P)H-binding protein [Frankia sp. AiPa1]MCL9760592.1 NAD(P)H-binding protein [Frankia sp. AiPa1]